jgi:biotin-(acetyl-CoA carboxylase) ligase
MSWLRSGIKAETIAQLPMLAAAAAHHAITRTGVADARIKWPNDILANGRKIAGILVFARHGETSWVTVGLGINLETVPVVEEGNGPPATSVAEQIGEGDVDTLRYELVCTFVDELDRMMEDPHPAIENWRELLIQRPGEEGFLKIRENGKEWVITGGDVIES